MINIISILSLSLTFLYVFIVLFLRKGWHRIKSFEKMNESVKTQVSIIIAARNEEDKIALTIEDILAQDYPKHLFELIVVDDHSTDGTSDIIKSYEANGVKLIELKEKEPLNSYKKKAISEAINLASGDLIVTTDADCRMNKNWLKTLVQYYEENSFNLISAPVVYFEEKSLFERLQTLEFLFLIGLGAAGIGNKMPSTCNGANLAYKRTVFFELDGFKGIDDLASGDDELFLHKVAKAYPNSIGFCKSYEAIVFTNAKANLREFMQQRKRWASKSVKYKDKRVIILALCFWLFNLLLLINVIKCIFYFDNIKFTFILFLIKFSVELYYLNSLLSFVKRKSLMINLTFLTFLHIIYVVYIGLLGNSGKYSWKGRMVK